MASKTLNQKTTCEVRPKGPSTLRLVTHAPCGETIEALETLLGLAKEGEVTGLAFGCTLRSGGFISDVLGRCYAEPTFTRGVVAFLADQVTTLQHESHTS